MKEINRKMIKGFMGRTHCLLSIMLMCICMLLPVKFFKETLWLLKDNILFFIVGLVVLVGGALLPDLDNSQSSAGNTLGPLGSICTIFMQAISSIIWTIYHGRNDMTPINQHRYLWHTFIVGIGFICLFWFLLPTGDTTILLAIKESGDILTFIQENTMLIFFIIIVFMAVLCGSDMLFGKILQFFKLPSIINYIFPTLIIVYIFTIDLNHLHILGICVGFGYLFHIIEDFFADSGIPLLWPIPIKNQVWHRCRFIVTCTTGGIINTILDIVILAIDVVLIALIFLEGRVTW
jgi:hypothetical protein